MTEIAVRPQTLVALTPQELPQVQAQILQWCTTSLIALGKELAEARQNLRQVKKLMLGSPKSWQNVAARVAKRMIYFAKIRAAVKAGYLVVPNFPCEYIAVRVDNAKPRMQEGPEYPQHYNRAEPQLNLPQGVGRYVDETNPHRDLSFDEKNDQTGKVTHQRWTRVDSYDETVDFPARFASPVVIAATEQALARKLFDRVGIVNGGTSSARWRKSDPIVVGEIIDGSQAKYRWSSDYPKKITFFIAWWLDPESL